jgi:hypothetical protein
VVDSVGSHLSTQRATIFSSLPGTTAATIMHLLNDLFCTDTNFIFPGFRVVDSISISSQNFERNIHSSRSVNSMPFLSPPPQLHMQIFLLLG